MPPCVAYVVAVRVRFSKPGPHALLQSPWLVHAACTQLAGPGVGAGMGAHEPKLQAAEFERPTHAVRRPPPSTRCSRGAT